MYHNPFAQTTKQPKIPDAKCKESLGFSTRLVKELKVANLAADGVMHILLFGGQNCGMVVCGSEEGTAWAKANSAGITDANALAHSFASAYEGSNKLGYGTVDLATGGKLTYDDEYARWRMVSQGARFTLLNVDDEDDGWFEAVRITEPLDGNGYSLSTTDGSLSSNNGTINPAGLLRAQRARSLANERSYTTGTLRSLGQHQFDLHPTGDDHDFNQTAHRWSLPGS